MGTKYDVRGVDDTEIRRRVIDRVIDVGGEVLDVAIDDGAVWLHVRLGERHGVALLERLLYEVDGVTSVHAQFAVGGERDPGTARA